MPGNMTAEEQAPKPRSAISVDAAVKSTTKARLVCIDTSGDNPTLLIGQERAASPLNHQLFFNQPRAACFRLCRGLHGQVFVRGVAGRKGGIASTSKHKFTRSDT
jgi:hypothetical protein